MNLTDLKSKIKSVTMVTDAELTAVFVIFIGLVLGLVYKNFIKQDYIADTGIADLQRQELLASVNKLFLDSVTGVPLISDLQINEPEHTVTLSLGNETIESKPKTQPFEKSTDKKININTASRVQLMRLPGIGEKTADKIIEYRKSNPFNRIEDIKKVHGIGEKKFEKMRDLIDVK